MKQEFYDSAGALKSNTAPPEFLSGDEIGFAQLASNVTVASGGSTNLNSFVITGDGVNYTFVHAQSWAYANGAACDAQLEIHDGTTSYGIQRVSIYANTARASLSSWARIPPFSGTKTLFFKGYAIASSVIFEGSATYPASFMRATRLKTSGIYAAPACRAVSTSATSLANNTWTPITFSSATQNVSSMWVAGTPTRITFTKPGFYDVSGAVEVVGNAAGARYTSLAHYNAAGTQLARVTGDSEVGSGIANYAGSTSQTLAVSAGDYVRLEVYQTIGSAVNTTATSGTYHATLSAVYQTPTVEVQKSSREIATQLYNAGSAAVASGTALATFTLTGDGVTPIYIAGQYDTDGAPSAGSWVSLRVFDSTVGSGATVMQENIDFATTRASKTVQYRVPPFTGTKTVSIVLVNGSSATTVVYAGNAAGTGGNSLGAWAYWG